MVVNLDMLAMTMKDGVFAVMSIAKILLQVLEQNHEE